MVIIEKEGDTIRDFRRLHVETVIDAYSMPRVDDTLDQVGQAKYNTTLDVAKG